VGNVVAPDYILEKYGADTMRLYILFMGPPEKDAEWQDEGLQGIWRFLQRSLRLVDMLRDCSDTAAGELNAQEQLVVRKIHSTIKEVTDDLEGNFQFNTAISRIMELVNQVYKALSEGALRKEVLGQAVDTLFLLLSPFTPHISEQASQALGHSQSIFRRAWPSYDEKYLQVDSVEIALMLNGKVRDKLLVQASWDQKKVEQEAFALPRIKELLAGKPPKKIVYVPNKLLNVVA